MVLHSRNSQKAKALFMLAALFCQRTNADVYRRVHTPTHQEARFTYIMEEKQLSLTHTLLICYLAAAWVVIPLFL